MQWSAESVSAAKKILRKHTSYQEALKEIREALSADARREVFER